MLCRGLPFVALPCRDVLDHRDGLVQIAVLVAYRRDGELSPDQPAVLAVVALLQRVAVAATRLQIGEVVAEHLAPGWITAGQVPGGIVRGDADRRGLEHGAIALFARAQQLDR